MAKWNTGITHFDGNLSRTEVAKEANKRLPEMRELFRFVDLAFDAYDNEWVLTYWWWGTPWTPESEAAA